MVHFSGRSIRLEGWYSQLPDRVISLDFASIDDRFRVIFNCLLIVQQAMALQTVVQSVLLVDLSGLLFLLFQRDIILDLRIRCIPNAYPGRMLILQTTIRQWKAASPISTAEPSSCSL